MPHTFESNEALFQAARDLIAALHAQDRIEPAGILAEGLGCLNGLTDGWAQFLAAIESVKKHKPALSEADAETLKALHAAAYQAVYRRKPLWPGC